MLNAGVNMCLVSTYYINMVVEEQRMEGGGSGVGWGGGWGVGWGQN